MSSLARITLLSILCLIIAGVQMGQADIYVYRDALGQRHFTNLIRKIPPKYRSRARLIVQTKGPKRLPSPDEEARVLLPPVEDRQVRRLQVVPPIPQQRVVTMPSPPQTAPSGVPPAPSFTEARSISTSQYGLLKLRMTQDEILQRLGPPAYVLDGRSDYRNIWYYPAGSGVPFTQLTFTSGKLTNMQRGFTEVR